MRVKASATGFQGRAYAGTTGVLLAMNVSKTLRRELLGFAIERREGSGPSEPLLGALHFPGQSHPAGKLVSTFDSPVQKFRWSDYRVHSGREYKYSIHAMRGQPGNLQTAETIDLNVRTHSSSDGKHRVLFNRAVAASQAFSRKFPNIAEQIENNANGEMPPAALKWLSRGMLEQIVGFIGKAKEGWALDLCIYEYELPEIVEAINRCKGEVRVVYHANPEDDQTDENEHNLRLIPASRKRGRITSNICHHKFMVLSKVTGGERRPQMVLCGSTNFTHNGIYRQANVAHIIDNDSAAAQYLDLFEHLFAGSTQTETRNHLSDNFPMPAEDGEMFIGFSPRKSRADLDYFVSQINRASQDVLFATAFNLDNAIDGALKGAAMDDILRFGIQNTATEITGIHADRTANFAAAALLNNGLEGWLKESTAKQRGNLLIHTKIVVVDFTSDDPIVISGSHNLSNNASGKNDENYLVIRGNTDVADSYGCEVMRIYDHYRFRWAQKQAGTGGNPPMLTADTSWTNRYFNAESLQWRDRVCFGGSLASGAHG